MTSKLERSPDWLVAVMCSCTAVWLDLLVDGRRVKGVIFRWLRENAKICLSNAIVFKFGPHVDKRKRSWKFEQNPIILSTFFGQNAEFYILTGRILMKFEGNAPFIIA